MVMRYPSRLKHYQMKNTLETTLYSAFTRMEKNGYITSFPGVGENGGKKRTYYSITDAGREYYKARCDEWTLTKEVIEHFIRK